MRTKLITVACRAFTPLRIGLASFTTFIISSRHFLYGLAVRHKVIEQPMRWRLPVSFVLTDELFAFSHHPRAYRTKTRLIYALSAGFSFYIAWNIWTLIGIVAGTMLPDLTNLGLDFAIAATFIADRKSVV